MPEIYDERRDPTAYARAGLAAEPMTKAARWYEANDYPWLHGVNEGFGGRPEALVAIFSAVQERYGYLPEQALHQMSDEMTIHWAQVFGAAGLGGFRLLPAEGHLVTVCDCAACRFAGGDELLTALSAELGIAPGDATDDGSWSLETSSEVGAGAIAPAIRIDTMVYGPLTVAQARHLIDERKRGDARAALPARAVAGARKS
jgi:NADH-quinone oxidoreductase subunit E